MQFSVYKSGMKRLELSMAQLLDVMQTEDEIDLINMAVRFEKPTLLCDEGGDEIIIKPLADHDEALTFEGLFDMALSTVDLKRLKETDTIELPLVKFELRFDLHYDPVPTRVLINARSNNEVYGEFRRLLQTNPEFRRALFMRFVEHIEREQGLAIGKPEVHRYAPVHPGQEGKGWEILNSEPGDPR
jgi:hypothetical protein